MKDLRSHWEQVYKTKGSGEVSWYQPHLTRSLELILRTSVKLEEARVIDIGGGASTLGDDLLAQGFRHVSVLDISSEALNVSKARLGEKAKQVTWIEGDITKADLPPDHYDVWHDRAVFHFLTAAEGRRAYIKTLLRVLRPGGQAVLATFGPQGPLRCSGLDIVRYGPETLSEELGEDLKLAESFREDHQTPFQTVQNFVYCRFIRK